MLRMAHLPHPLSEGDYDAAIKRLLRRLPTFEKEWLAKNTVGLEDWKEAR